jgi:hypothetical protein
MYFDNNGHIDDYFRQHLKDYSEAPDDSVWKNIEGRLSHEAKTRRLFIYKTAAIALAIIGLTVFLAIEVSWFYSAEKDLTSMNLERELTINSDGLNTYQKDLNQNIAYSSDEEISNVSDISTPQVFLYSGNIMNSEEKIENNSATNRENLIKLTALREPVVIEDQEETGVFVSRSLRNSTFPGNRNTLDQTQKAAFFQDKNEKNKFSLNGSFSPILSYRHSKAKSRGDMPVESSLLSYSGGMELSYNLAEKLTIRTGMHYTKFGQSLNNIEITTSSYAMDNGKTVVKVASSMGQGQVEFEKLLNVQQVDNSSKNITFDNSGPPEFTVESAVYQTFEMVKMPFVLEYTLLDEKFNFSMKGGINANLLVNEGIYMEQAQGTKQIGSTKNLNTLSYSGSVGVGLKYDISQKAQLFMEPSFDYYITSLTSDDSYKTFPYFFGFFSGVSISF